MAQQSHVGRVATTVQRGQDGTLRVVYHSTEVVFVSKSGRVTLDSGGWRTQTTKTRMNQASHQYGLRFSVYSKDHTWLVDYWRESWERRKTIPFRDRMRVPV